MHHIVEHLSWCPSHYMYTRLVETQSILLANIKFALQCSRLWSSLW